MVVEKPVDIDKSHPHLEKDAVAGVNLRLKSLLTPEDLTKRLSGSGLPKHRFTSWDFQAVVYKEGWKMSNRNQFHIRLTNPEIRRYSDEAVLTAADNVATSPDYLDRCRALFRQSRPRRQAKAFGNNLKSAQE